MKRNLVAAVLASALFLYSCTGGNGITAARPQSGNYTVYYLGAAAFARGGASTELRGVWVSQFDMHPVYRTGSRQRDEEDYRRLVDIMLDNLVRDGFNAVFLQVRPNGDSMYESEIYPCSKYVAGSYGGKIEYDAVRIFLELAKARGLAVHAWINPYRLCTIADMEEYTGNCVLKEWHSEPGRRIKKGEDGLLYLDPSYPEATALIAAGADEILQKYGFDGIHIDDYFYPTEFEFDDSFEFAQSGYSDLGDFRRENVNRTVKALYDTAHKHGKIFGIAPSGNIYSLENGWYADIYRWCGEIGYADYIMPQLYFGFNNLCCPFETVLADWCDATRGGAKLYVGLSVAKCAAGSEGKPDIYAGEAGKYEWRDSKDIIARSLEAVKRSDARGFCLFCYSSLYDPVTGEENPLVAAEKAAFAGAIKG
ncbi:MAG: family 10 glycosylhydrolase [Clostridia bacterium]|nr:family 10 glycosylhydrolase [Clostridia bacterium]